MPLRMVLFAAARQMGEMYSVELTGADSFSRHMSLSLVEVSYDGWHVAWVTFRDTSLGLGPAWLMRPRKTVMALGSLSGTEQEGDLGFVSLIHADGGLFSKLFIVLYKCFFT